MRTRTAAALAAVAWAAGMPVVGAGHLQGGWVSPADDPAALTAPTDLVGWIDSATPRPNSVIRARLSLADGASLPAGCPVEAIEAQPAAPPPSSTTSTTALGPPYRTEFLFASPSVTPVCNGVYRADVLVSDFQGAQPETVLTRALHFSLPPPAVVALQSATQADGTVALQWEPPPGLPPDATGYAVQRSIGGGEWERRATTGLDTLSHVDGEFPAEGAEVTYRVLALRADAASGTVASVDGTTVTATVERSAPPATVRRRTRPRRTTATAPPTTFDVVPESELEEEPGEDDPVLPADADQLGGPILQDVEPGADGRALAVPAASALLLVVWAAHIRYVARLAARPDGGGRA